MMNIKKIALTSVLKPSFILAGFFLVAHSAQAINTVTTTVGANTVTTCKRTPAGLSSFMMEHTVDVADIKSTLTPQLPDSAFSDISSGKKEVRSRISYDKTTKVLKNLLFLVNPGAPLPSPSTIDFEKEKFAWVTASIDKIYLSCKPRATVLLAGIAIDGYPVFLGPAGSSYAFAFSYTVGTSTQGFTDIISLSTGIATIYHDVAPGTIAWSTKRSTQQEQ